MMIVNPLTGQVLNANPEGCNQHTGKNCVPGKHYKKVSETRGRKFTDRVYEGPFDSVQHAGIHQYTTREDTSDRDLDSAASRIRDGYLVRRNKEFIPVTEGSLLQEDIDAYNSDDLTDEGRKVRVKIIPARPITFRDIYEEEMKKLTQR